MAPFTPLGLELYTASGESWPVSDPQIAAFQGPPALTPRSLDSGMLGVGWGKVKFQTLM